MGNTGSYEASPLLDHLSKLLEDGDVINIEYWNTLLQHGMKKEYRAKIPPKLLYEIAKKQPDNVLKLLHVCITYLTTIPLKNSNEYIGVFFYKQFNTVLQLTVSFFIVASTDKSLSSLNHRLFYSPSGNVSLGERLIKALVGLLFCPNVSMPENSENWDSTYISSTRFDDSLLDVLHALFLFYSREAFAGINEIHYDKFLLMPSFPYQKFLFNLCKTCNYYMRSLAENHKNTTKEAIIRHCICILAEFLYIDTQFSQSISKMDPKLLMEALFYEIPITNFNCPLAIEGLTLVHIFLTNKPEFGRYIAAQPEGLKITESIMTLMLKVYDTTGISYIHTIAISCLMHMLCFKEAEPIINAQFNDHRNETISTILIMALIKISSEDFMLSLLCLIHTISPYIKNFSEEAARALLIIVQGLITKSNVPKISTLLQVITDIFAHVFACNPKDNQKFINFMMGNVKIVEILPDSNAKSLILNYLHDPKNFNPENYKLMNTNHSIVGFNMKQSWPSWCYAIFTQNAIVELNPSNTENK